MKIKFLVILFHIASLLCYSQNTISISLTISQAEDIFLKKNLLLLASQYDISVAKAGEIEAKLYNNPVFSAELAAYGANNKVFDVGKNGQKVFVVDQLINLAGKRNKRVLIAKEQTKQAEFAFYELIRTLKYEFRQHFYSLAYANELIEKYDEQINFLQQIIRSYDEQVAKRNVSLKDAIRLKSESIQLSADRNTVMMEAVNAQQTLRILLDTSATIIPVKESREQNTALPSTASLLEIAKQTRTDLKLYESQVKQEQLNFSYQKALATPDLNIGAGYDQSGSYINNYYSLRTGIELPLFNRNQGNIKAAKAQIKSAELVRDYKVNEIEKQVLAGISKIELAEREYQSSQQSFDGNFPEVNKSVIENFNKGNLTLLDFMDFFENYNTTIRQINQLHKQRRLAWEELEYTIGARID